MDFSASSFEIKTLSETGQIEGLLAGFNNIDHGGDRLLPGTFTKTLAERTAPLPMLLHHDMTRPIGAWKTWQEGAEGVYVKGQLTLASRDAQEAYALAKDGALGGLSIGWAARKSTTDQRTGVRTVTEADLFEGSLVAIPMNSKTRVASVKTISNVRDIEDLLQEGGMSGRKAKAAASAAWKALNQNENDDASSDLAEMLRASTARLTGAK